MKTQGSPIQSARDIFSAALEQPADQQAAFVAASCRGDANLRSEVESLLAHDRQARDDFLKPPEPPAAHPFRADEAANANDPLIGTRVGRYHIKSRIAIGGMGNVYEAVQEAPHRVVALKILRPNVASRSALRRFQFESQVLARLRHPNVAQVFEAGMHGGEQRPGTGKTPLPDGRGPDETPLADTRGSDATGVPYFAMEYIPGARTLVDFAGQAELTIRQRLELFTKVCDAVHHGHQKGIIHRDLKPANILVDAAGEPKVIDFGVARATDSDLAATMQQTNVGQLVGTMQYMSPEQCDADPHDIDTRSDVYSLGVVLHELLSGALPYETTGSTIFQATQIIKQRAPRALSEIDRKLRGDIETIALHALEKSRERRYQSAAELAADVRRFLNHEPIQAHAPSAWRRMAHWIARHPLATTVVLCFVVLALTVAATFASVWWVNQRPYEIVLSKHPDWILQPFAYEAQFRAYSGRTIKSWSSANPQGIRIAELVARPTELGGGRVILLGINGTADAALNGRLTLFDADGDLEQPLLSLSVDTEDIPPELREIRSFVGEQFNIRRARVFDVFPDRPGAEIVAVFNQQSHSQSVIRIYDLAGELLYQVWYDGAVQDCYWMAGAKLLVFAGDCHWGLYDEHGQPKGQKLRDRVVFALRPKVGVDRTGWLIPDAEPIPDDAGRAAWFLRVSPEFDSDRALYVDLTPAPDPHGPKRCVRFTIRYTRNRHIAVGWVLDEHGEEIPGSRIVSDEFGKNLRLPADHPDKLDLPDRCELQLVPYNGDRRSPP